jgi:hypothetical protein
VAVQFTPTIDRDLAIELMFNILASQLWGRFKFHPAEFFLASTVINGCSFFEVKIQTFLNIHYLKMCFSNGAKMSQFNHSNTQLSIRKTGLLMTARSCMPYSNQKHHSMSCTVTRKWITNIRRQWVT